MNCSLVDLSSSALRLPAARSSLIFCEIAFLITGLVAAGYAFIT